MRLVFLIFRVVVGAESREDVVKLIREAIELHLETMQQEGQPIPASFDRRSC
jgi:predicted RNase H-like HicB family nuclease